MSAADLLQVQGLTVASVGAQRSLLHDFQLHVQPGERVGIVGASGSGKSLAARAILGLLPPGLQQIAGSVRYADRALRGEVDFRGVRGTEIGYLFQDAAASLHPLRTLAAQFDECLRVHTPRLPARERQQRIGQALTEVGLAPGEVDLRRYPHQISGGQRQRMLIALTLLTRPRLLIADEPTSALDPVLAGRICALLAQRVAESGMALLFISHDLPRVAQLCTRILVLDEGELVESAAADALLRRPASVAGQRLAAAAQMPRHAQAPDLQAQPMVVAQGLALAYRAGWRWPWQPKPAPALQPLDLCLRRGQRIGVVGSSGSGKSTLARGLLRVLPPVAGSVNWWGTEVTHWREPRLRALRPRIQMVFQDPYRSLDPLQRVDAMLAEAIGCGAQEPEGAASSPPSPVALLESVGLDASALSRYPTQFSGGQRQRLAIARALATSPAVLVCDEATSALDLATQAQILELLDTLIRERQLSLILIAHDLAAIERLCDTVLVLDGGRLVEQGSPAELYANPRSPALRALLDARMLS